MPAEFIRVRDTRIEGNNILPNRVPRAFLKSFPHLKEVPSGKSKAETTTVTEPVQPAARVPVTEPATAEATPATTKEPAKPEKK